MKNEDNLEYAEHNWKTCKYLDRKPEFADWVITTAFYSALHYVRYKIFPITIERANKRIEIKDFEIYFRTNNPFGLSKHSLLSNLVEEKHSKIANDYNKLRDISWSARYSNYKYPREISNDAKKRLQKIKEYCTK
ncbi:hypothetical protein K8R61_01695 [bacterium]|nr:hypothetical protein [bacterium]